MISLTDCMLRRVPRPLISTRTDDSTVIHSTTIVTAMVAAVPLIAMSVLNGVSMHRTHVDNFRGAAGENVISSPPLSAAFCASASEHESLAHAARQ